MEKQQLYEKIQKLEKQKSELEINFSVQQERNERLKEEKQKIEQEYTITKNYNKDLELKREQTTSKQIQELSSQLNEQKEKNSKIINDLEKELALSKQEKIFLEKELKSLQSKNQENEFELKQMREEARTHKNEADKLQQKIENIEREKQQEIQKIQEEHAKSLEIQKAQSEDKKEMQKQQQEWLVQKTYLENQVSFLKNQLDENKRLHDALLMALQQGMNHQDQENAGELMETNKNLSAAMEKMELRCSLLEEKNEKLKNFKKMVKNSSALQCIHCSKFISNTIFTQHLKNCIEINGTDSSNQKTQNLPQLSKAQMEFTNNLLNNQQYNNSNQNSTNNNNNYNGPALFQNLEANGLIISINQTMVRESPDNKPYTEYLIQVQYLNQKWTVARKYKNFCELHSVLQNSFQGLKFPQSSAAIINSQTDVNSVFSNKRPTVIEERRKALQQYIRDLCQIDVVRNSKPYKNFLEIEKHLEKVSSYQNSRQNSTVNKNVPGTSRSEIMSMVNSFFQNKNNSQIMQNNNEQENKIVPQSPQSFLKNLQENQNRENQNSSMTSDIYSTPQQNNQQQYNMKQKQQQQYQKQMQQMGGHTKNQNSFSNNSYNNYNNNNNNQPLSNSNNFMNSNNIYANHANNNRMNYNQKREQNNQQMQYQNFQQYDSENMYQQQNQWNAGNY
ncbi:Phox homologous domain [Pseudocohnilembus persalinus]|uniref:Phox homologous domain n=1 Tax=Pseudocohnilembus persalinus TaxID=266149 RepID=A0A0V0R6J8_PSEPJ|nr:Phox homologous domain [Pseudocohnilembus persalinus]|eukprot:KRX10134.1 Phox homologous domain [Pseudocohnilembus persalinus]